jgi:hypothetical protein
LTFFTAHRGPLIASKARAIKTSQSMTSAVNTSKSALCFVVGPIGKDGSSERKHADLLLNAVIKHVLEGSEFGYHVKRADEDTDPGMIGDRVIADIINAALVIADLTDLNPNAFYELGIRHSTELPTIHMAKLGTALPFDNVAHRTIFVDLGDWHSIEQARTRLADSVRATNAPGYLVSNPITQANASFKMRQSEDPRDRAHSRTNDADLTSQMSPKDREAIDRLESLVSTARNLVSSGHDIEQIKREISDRARKMDIQLFEFEWDNSGNLKLKDNKGYGLETHVAPPSRP